MTVTSFLYLIQINGGDKMDRPLEDMNNLVAGCPDYLRGDFVEGPKRVQ